MAFRKRFAERAGADYVTGRRWRHVVPFVASVARHVRAVRQFHRYGGGAAPASIRPMDLLAGGAEIARCNRSDASLIGRGILRKSPGAMPRNSPRARMKCD